MKTIIAALLAASIVTAEEPPASITVTAPWVNPSGCVVLAAAPLVSGACEDTPVNSGELQVAAATYNPNTASCTALFHAMAAGRWLIVVAGEDQILGEVRICVPAALAGRDILVTTDHHRIRADGFEAGFVAWTVVE